MKLKVEIAAITKYIFSFKVKWKLSQRKPVESSNLRFRILFCSIWLSQKLLSFYKEIIDAQHFLFYIILLNYVRYILFYYYKMDHA